MAFPAPRVAFILLALGLCLSSCRHAADPVACEPIVLVEPPIEVVDPAPPCSPLIESNDESEPQVPATNVASEPAEAEPPAERATPLPPNTVVADGYGVVIGGDVAAARRAAIDDALTGAIEQVLGVSLESERLAENYALISQRIGATSDGFIRRYDILEETREGDLIHLRVAAVVAEDRWRAEGLDRLRVAVEARSTNGLHSEEAASELRRLMRSRGIEVVDRGERCDLLVCAEVQSAIVNTFGGRHVAESEVTLSVRRSSDGVRILERTSRLRGERSNQRDVALRSAQATALGAAAGGLEEDLLTQRDRMASHRLLVCGVSSWRCRDALTRGFERLEGVARAEMEIGDCGTAAWDLELSPQALRDFPRNLERLEGVQLRVSATGPHRTVARLDPTG